MTLLVCQWWTTRGRVLGMNPKPVGLLKQLIRFGIGVAQVTKAVVCETAETQLGAAAGLYHLRGWLIVHHMPGLPYHFDPAALQAHLSSITLMVGKPFATTWLQAVV